ncbi:TerD family protein [Streptomyces sp. NPDC053048]|uniref:TerD family protein n=1 Tax=Streptomyces sp. NPDC053048 TaxID=3365694 RepID=UPI0037D5E497
MSREFQRGHKAKISDLTAGTDLYVGVQIGGSGLTFDISCFGLDAQERLSDDRYFVFFNQPKSPEGAIQQLGAQAGDTESFRVTLDRIPAHIHKLSFTATLDGPGQMSQTGPGYIRVVAGGTEVARYSFTGAEFSTERAVMLGDFYLKDVWRFAAVGQGFDGGLEALLKNFGGEVLEEESPAPAPSAAPAFAPPQQDSAPPAFAPPAAAQPPAAAPQAVQSPPPPPPAQSFAPPPGATPPPVAPPAPQVHAAATMAAPIAPPGHFSGGQTPPGGTVPPPPGPPGMPAQPAPYAQPAAPTQAFGAQQPYGRPAVPAQPYPAQQSPHALQPQQAPYGAPAPGAAQHQGTGAPAVPGVQAAFARYREAPNGQRWTLQNPRLVRVDLGADPQPVLARQGSMVLYQGKVDFSYKGAGFMGRIVGNATGQEMQLMRCTGRGQVFLADDSSHVHPIQLENDAICVSADAVLAFDESLHHEVRRIEGHGIPGGALFTMQFHGTGTVVVKTHGTPVVLPVTPTTFADSNAVVAWSAGSQVIVSSQVRLRRTSYPGHSGETVNLQFRGAPGNFIVVQPYEV